MGGGGAANMRGVEEIYCITAAERLMGEISFISRIGLLYNCGRTADGRNKFYQSYRAAL
jgi:hypothetical protein